MKRETYAKHLKSLGLDLEDQDVFHIIANSKGGADHPDNFLYALGKHFNRSIGDGYDDLNCFLAGKVKCEKAILASMRYGNKLDKRNKPLKFYDPKDHGSHYPRDEATLEADAKREAERLFEKGQQLFRAIRAERREENRNP